MGGAGNSGQEPGSQVAVTGGGSTPLWGGAEGVPGGGSDIGGLGGVPGEAAPDPLRPYELETASKGAGPGQGLLAAPPVGLGGGVSTFAGATTPGFTSAPSPTPQRWEDYDKGKVTQTPTEKYFAPVVDPAPPPAPAPPPPADPWAGRVQIFGSGAEGFGTDTAAQWMARWPSQAQAEQRPGTDNWYLPVGVAR